MRTVRCVRRVAGAAPFIFMTMMGALALCCLGTEQAFAIPSPELVVGSFVSISQLFALASAVLGGGAAYATMRARKKRGSAEMSRGLPSDGLLVEALPIIADPQAELPLVVSQFHCDPPRARVPAGIAQRLTRNAVCPVAHDGVQVARRAFHLHVNRGRIEG